GRTSTRGVTDTPSVGKSSAELSDDDIIMKAAAAKNGPAFSRLWAGDTSDYNNDHSSADQALCNMLAFWCGRDTERMDRLFRMSGLCRRDKWEERADYRQRTIDKAIAGCREVYTPRQPESTK